MVEKLSSLQMRYRMRGYMFELDVLPSDRVMSPKTGLAETFMNRLLELNQQLILRGVVGVMGVDQRNISPPIYDIRRN